MYKKCLLCNKDLHQNTWNDERGVVEYIHECHNINCLKYRHHWYYGISKVNVLEVEMKFADHGYLDKKDSLIARNSWNNISELIKIYKLKMLIK